MTDQVRLLLKLKSVFKKYKESYVENTLLKKCDQEALRLLSEANKLYSRGNYSDAVDKFNEGLCFVDDSDRCKDFYFNRAISLYQMKLPGEALYSIGLAESGVYPEKLRERLTKMTSMCKEKIRIQEKKPPPFRLELSYPPNEQIPSIANCLELKCNEKYGRHIVTTKDLRVGDVIMVSDGFLRSPIPVMRYLVCPHCLSDKRHLFVPCTSCPNALYCSEECQKDAWDKYHKLECHVPNVTFLNGNERNALRMFLSGVAATGTGDLTEFQEFLRENETNVLSPFDLDYNRPDAKREFLAMHHLHYDPSVPIAQMEHHMNQCGILACIILHAMKMDSVSDDQLDFILTTTHRYLTTAKLNSYSVTSGGSKCGAIIPSVMSLVNHSCAPNTFHFQQDGKLVLMVNIPIRAGDPISTCYLLPSLEATKIQRQADYKHRYGFDCTCVACERNYPTLFGLPRKGLRVPRRTNAIGRKAMLDWAKQMKAFIQSNWMHYPCQEIADAQVILECIYDSLFKNWDYMPTPQEFFSRLH